MPAKVLIFESSESLGKSLKSRLETFGAHVDLTQTENELLLHKGPFDLAISESALSLFKSLNCPLLLWTNQDIDPAAVHAEKAFKKSDQGGLIIEAEMRIREINDSLPESYNILVVDDSLTIRNFVSKILSHAFPNATVKMAEDGKTAISSMTSGRVDLIFTDLQMPGMDGESFLQILRKNSLFSKKSVIILSSTIPDELRKNLSAVPHYRLLDKPSSPEEIARAVRDLLSAKVSPTKS